MQRQAVIALLLIFLLLPVARGQDIFTAARTGDLRRMEELMKINPDTLNSRNASGFTPLIIAGYRNQAPAVKFLLEHKADVNADSPEGPALLGTCYKGNTELVQLLIDHRADVNATNGAGTSALMYAALINQPGLVRLLLKYGAKKELKEKSGKTALDYAQANHSTEIIALLSE